MATFVYESGEGAARPNDLRKNIRGRLTVSGSEGASAGDIPASLFGLNKIEKCSPLVADDDSLVVVASPSYDGESLIGRAAGTNSAADLPADTYRVEVTGI